MDSLAPTHEMSTIDNSDWYRDADAGTAGAHIAYFVAWLASRSLTASGMISPSTLRVIESRNAEAILSELDGKLVSAMMQDAAQQFSEEHYLDYLAAYARLRTHDTSDQSTYHRLEAFLDEAYARWMSERGPDQSGTTRRRHPRPPSAPRRTAGYGRRDVVRALQEVDGRDPAGSSPVAGRTFAYVFKELSETPGRKWADGRVTVALAELGIQSDQVVVRHGILGAGRTALMVVVYVLPVGRPLEIEQAFRLVPEQPSDVPWELRLVGGTRVWRARGREFTAAYWTTTDTFIHLASPSARVVDAAVRQWAPATSPR